MNLKQNELSALIAELLGDKELSYEFMKGGKVCKGLSKKGAEHVANKLGLVHKHFFMPEMSKVTPGIIYTSTEFYNSGEFVGNGLGAYDISERKTKKGETYKPDAADSVTMCQKRSYVNGIRTIAGLTGIFDEDSGDGDEAPRGKYGPALAEACVELVQSRVDINRFWDKWVVEVKYPDDLAKWKPWQVQNLLKAIPTMKERSQQTRVNGNKPAQEQDVVSHAH